MFETEQKKEPRTASALTQNDANFASFRQKPKLHPFEMSQDREQLRTCSEKQTKEQIRAQLKNILISMDDHNTTDKRNQQGLERKEDLKKQYEQLFASLQGIVDRLKDHMSNATD